MFTFFFFWELGSIAEREHKKWENAAPLKNNPYSRENIEKRLQEKDKLSGSLPEPRFALTYAIFIVIFFYLKNKKNNDYEKISMFQVLEELLHKRFVRSS